MLASQWGLKPSKLGFSSYFSQLALSLYLEPKTKKSFNCVREAQVWNIFLLKKNNLKYIWIWGPFFIILLHSGALLFEKLYVVRYLFFFSFFVGLNMSSFTLFCQLFEVLSNSTPTISGSPAPLTSVTTMTLRQRNLQSRHLRLARRQFDNHFLVKKHATMQVWSVN